MSKNTKNFSPSGEKILQKSNGATFLIDTNDLIGSSLVNNGYWEPNVEEIIREITKKDFVCIDVGAYFGVHSVISFLS